jgi:hypothetical protein
LDILTISRRLGRSMPSTTLEGHRFKGADGKAADAIDALLGGN